MARVIPIGCFLSFPFGFDFAKKIDRFAIIGLLHTLNRVVALNLGFLRESGGSPQRALQCAAATDELPRRVDSKRNNTRRAIAPGAVDAWQGGYPRPFPARC
jgi:hypothetical protein